MDKIFTPSETSKIINNVCDWLGDTKQYFDKLEVLNAVSYALLQAENVLTNRNAKAEPENEDEETEFDDDVITIAEAANVFDSIFDAVIGQRRKFDKEQKKKLVNHLTGISGSLDDIVFNIENEIVNIRMLIDNINKHD